MKRGTPDWEIRERIALAYMQAMMTRPDLEFPDEQWRVGLAVDAYRMADAMVTGRAIVDEENRKTWEGK